MHWTVGVRGINAVSEIRTVVSVFGSSSSPLQTTEFSHFGSLGVKCYKSLFVSIGMETDLISIRCSDSSGDRNPSMYITKGSVFIT